MALLDVDLSNHIPAGWYATWRIDSFAANRFRVVLRDSQATHVDTNTRGKGGPDLVDTNSKRVGPGLRLTVENISASDGAHVDDDWHLVVNPRDPARSPCAVGYNAFIEDSSDFDLNDLTISLTAHKSGA
ncbi:hypothetical protein ACFU3E_00525 [Streptomyces sp. NPDC057424]|uniref:hypothetical protein n=1 Tax=Streptomyces sp. NPDC057424 TaxID=3346127 RepID=UPI00368EDE4F